MKEYNKSIQIMKLVAAFFVVLLHSLGHSGVLQNLQIHTIQYYVGWMLESLAYGAVDIFVISTGYFLIHKEKSTTKIINTYFITVWYMLIGGGVALLYYNEFSVSDLINIFLPLSRNAYGFVTCYVGVCLFAPLINFVSNKLDKKMRTTILIIIVVFGSIWPTVLIDANYWDINYGYSLLWFLCLYYIGGYIHDYPIVAKRRTWLFVYLISSLSSNIIGFVAREITISAGLSFKGEGILLHYNSITVLAASIAFFCFFAGKSYVSTNKVFWSISTTTLGIYLLHDNYIIRRILWIPLESNNNVLFCVVYATVIFAVCIVIDSGRRFIFKIAGISKLSNAIETKITKYVNKLSNYLEYRKKDII